MRRMAIQGLGVLGGFGCGRAELENRLAAGPAAPAELVVPSGKEDLRLPAHLADPAPLERFASRRATRRIDHFSKMALLGAHLALEDAGAPEGTRERMGVLIASGYGAARTTFAFLDSVFDDGDACASPTHFSNSVHNAAAAHVAIQLGATGPNLTVSQFEMSVASALLTAGTWLTEGRVDSVLFGAVDEACAVLGYCWERFFPSAAGPIAPFAFERQTAIPGEGAAFFLLDGKEKARYGHITRVAQGRAGTDPLPPGGTFLLGADGHRRCGANYQRLLAGPAKVAAYAPHFGSLPTGQAFDLAIAAIAARDGRLPPAPAPAELPGHWRPAAGASLDGPLGCLKCDDSGAYGLLVVDRG